MVVEKLHGLCKGFSKSLEDGGSWIQFDLEDSQLLEQFGKYHEKHIPFKDIETEKTLFIACLVNVECIAKELVDSSGPSEIWPMLDLFKIKSVQTLIDLIKSRSQYLQKFGFSWWPFLHEYLPGLPKLVPLVILEAIKDKSFRYILTCIQVQRGGKDIPKDLDFQSLDLLELCFAIKTMLDDNDTNEKDKKLQVFNYKPMPIDVASNIFIEAKNVLIDKIQKMSIDVWMGFAEKTTKYLDFLIASWWTSQEMMPSNYQLLIAQYCHELVILAPELNAVLSNFAREYQREYELGLDELELDEILVELEKDGIEDWKIKAYVKHLTKPDTFTEIFKIKKVLNILIRYPKEMVDIIDQICSLSNKTELHFKLILSILRLCDLIKVKSVFEKDIFSKYVEMISEEIFEQELRTFLNKIVVTNKTDYEQDWLILVMQNPQNAVDIVLKEAIENPGKVDLAIDLFLKLPSLDQYEIPEKLIAAFEYFDNIGNLIIKLGEKHDKFAQDIIKLLIKFALKNEKCTLEALEIMSKLKFFNKNHVDYDVILYIDSIINSKRSRKVADGEIQKLLHDFIQDSEIIDKDDQLLMVPWMKPYQWSHYDNLSEAVDTVIIAIDFIDDIEHKMFVIKQLSDFLSKKEDISALDNLIDIHDKVVYLMTRLYDPTQQYQGLQNCQTKLLNMILEKDNEIDFEHLISVIATMPECDAKKLSLTKLKMILDLSNT